MERDLLRARGRFVDPGLAMGRAGGEAADVTDEELAEVARRVRVHRRQSRVAMIAAGAVAVSFGAVGGLVGVIVFSEPKMTIRAMAAAFVIGCLVGGTLWQRLAPKSDPYYED